MGETPERARSRWRWFVPAALVLAGAFAGPLISNAQESTDVLASALAGGLVPVFYWLPVLVTAWVLRLVVRRRRPVLDLVLSPWLAAIALAGTLHGMHGGVRYDGDLSPEQKSLVRYLDADARCYAQANLRDSDDEEAMVSAVIDEDWATAAEHAKRLRSSFRWLSFCMRKLADATGDDDLEPVVRRHARGAERVRAGYEIYVEAIDATRTRGLHRANRRLAMGHKDILVSDEAVKVIFRRRGPAEIAPFIDADLLEHLRAASGSAPLSPGAA